LPAQVGVVGALSGQAGVVTSEQTDGTGADREPEPQSGRPRLAVVPATGTALKDEPEAFGYEPEFPLSGERTTIGSAADQDIVLDGLAPQHAVIQWLPEGDEYVFRPLVGDGAATVDGAVAVTGLHHGDRLDLGSWILVFQRDEASVHVRRERARQGGQYAGGGVTQAGGHSTEHSS
jgi:hypothetical protein